MPPINDRPPPPIPSTPRPPVPQHGQSTPPSANGRHPSVHKSPRGRGQQEPLPPPRQPQLPPIPPLPSRTVSGGGPATRPKKESPPPVSGRATSPPQQPNPPLPSRAPNRPSARVPPPKKAPPQKRSSSSSMRVTPDIPDRPQPPSRGQRGDGESPSSSKSSSGPVLPPRQPSTRGGPPTPSKPLPGGNRPKPPPPARPTKKQPGLASPPAVGGHTHRDDGPLNFPSGEGMSPREMAECIERDVPSLLQLISDRHNSVPNLLEKLATLIENFADNSSGSNVHFRIMKSSLRSQIGVLQDNASSVWQSNSSSIVEALNTIQHNITSMSKSLID